MIGVLLKLLIAYALGSVSGSLLLGTLRHVDIRTLGSGNAGGTNALRTQGAWFALGVALIDVGKGVLAAWLVPRIPIAEGPLTGLSLALACGAAAVIGHCYPVWHGFRGGKGAATLVGVLLALAPWLVACMLVTWMVVLVLTGYVSLGSMLAAAVLLPAAWWLGSPEPILWFAGAMAVFIAFTHRANIRRLLHGCENRFERVRLFRRR